MAKKAHKIEAMPTTTTKAQTEPTTPAPVATTSEAPTPQTKTSVAEKRSNVRTAKSRVKNPVEVVHVTVAEMKKVNPEVTRKELMTACEAKEIAYFTARTQVQRALKKIKAATN